MSALASYSPAELRTPATSAKPSRVKFAGIALRTVFLCILFVLVARVSSPQHVGSTWLDMRPGDLIRTALGVAVCMWIVIHMFILPKDSGAFRTWVYLGAILTPLAVLCSIVVW